MKYLKSRICTIFIILILVSIYFLSVILENILVFIVAIIFLTILIRLAIRLEVKKLTLVLQDLYKEEKYEEALKFLEEKEGSFWFPGSNNYCLINILPIYMTLDNIEKVEYILNNKRIVRKSLYTSYIQFILAISKGETEKAKYHSNRILKNKKNIAVQKNMTNRINKMLETRVFDEEVYENTKYPIVKRICLAINDPSVIIYKKK